MRKERERAPKALPQERWKGAQPRRCGWRVASLPRWPQAQLHAGSERGKSSSAPPCAQRTVAKQSERGLAIS